MALTLSCLMLVTGCKNQVHENKSEHKVHRTSKRIFKSGVPKSLRGTYYQVRSIGLDDGFYELKISDHSFYLKRVGVAKDDDIDSIDFSNISCQKLGDNTYILKNVDDYYTSFIKVILSPENKEITVSKNVSVDESSAKRDKELMIFTKVKPEGYFGILARDLFDNCYISDWDGSKFYLFREYPIETCLLGVNQQGDEYLIKGYSNFNAKIYGYELSNSNTDEKTLLIPISNTQLKDVNTGETFTRYRYPKNAHTLYREIRERLGLSPEKDKLYTPPPVKKKETKTYDFADDQDDDYYDTYDDFDLNNGD